MKKILTLASVAFLIAATSQAATINWGNTTGTLITTLGGGGITQTQAVDANLTITLYNITDGSALQTLSGSSAISGMTAGLMINAGVSFTYGDGPTSTGENDQFMVMLTATFAGTDYYMDIYQSGTTPWTFTGTDNSAIQAFSWTAGGGGGPGTVGQTNVWIPVPEPASGMLALAGAAMLLRRRRRA